MATVPAGSPPTGAVVGTSDTQELTNKTLTQPIITLEQGASVAPTAEGRIAWDTDDNKLKIGDGAATKTISPDDVAATLASKTLTAPTIADFTNATHDHGDADDGGLTFAMVPAATLSGRRITPYRIVPFNSFSTLAMAANTLYGFPVWLRKGESLGALSVDVTAFAAVFARMGLYAFDPATGMGGARLWDAGAVSVNTSNGWKDATSGANYAVPESGLYIAAIVSDGTPTVRSLGGHVAQSAVFGQDQTTGSASVQVGHSIAFTAGANCANALPDPFGSASFIAIANQVALVFPKLA